MRSSAALTVSCGSFRSRPFVQVAGGRPFRAADVAAAGCAGAVARLEDRPQTRHVRRVDRPRAVGRRHVRVRAHRRARGPQAQLRNRDGLVAWHSGVHQEASVSRRRPRRIELDTARQGGGRVLQIGACGRAGPGLPCAKRLREQHGRASRSDWTLVALGKLGGLELTATSDLDLMLVYEIHDSEPSADEARGAAPTTQYFNKLAQHVIAMLGSTDTDGPLFEVDFRLRPWGKKGPIATRLSTLRDYLDPDAWTYERMAMTRARVIGGTPHFTAGVQSVFGEALRRSTDRSRLRTDLLEMHALSTLRRRSTIRGTSSMSRRIDGCRAAGPVPGALSRA